MALNSATSAPFFIVGSGRSGTTLLRMILASHSRISIPPETWYLNRMTDLLDVDRPLTAPEVDIVTKIMVNHYRWPDLKFDASEFFQEVAALQSPRLRDIVELVYKKHLSREGKVRWGDKTPGYIEFVPQLSRMFPGAKFIHLIRDGRDVAKSFQSRRWNGKWLHDNAHEWIEATRYAQQWRDSAYSAQFFGVRYEDLVLNPERTVRGVCDFIGEQFEPEMLSWRHRIGAMVPEREASIHEKLGQLPGPEDIFRWKNEMGPAEKFVCEAFMGQQLADYGYELEFAATPWAPVLGLTRRYCTHVLPVVDLVPSSIRAMKRRIGAVAAHERDKARANP
jgi:hypothetical protein